MKTTTQTPRWQVLACSAILGLFAAGPALAVDQADFELDGNAITNFPGLTEDWDQFWNNANGNPVFVPDQVPPLATERFFTGGGSKDDNAISGWRHSSGSSTNPDKNNITNAYAKAYPVIVGADNHSPDPHTHLIIAFGADRFANDGDAALGFWFFQDDVGLLANGRFSGEHIDGDVLVQVDYVQGGAKAEIQIFEWTSTGAGGTHGTPTKVLKEIAFGAADGATVCLQEFGHDVACATTNENSVASPWPYTPKSGTPGIFPPRSFFEGIIDITQVLDRDACFSSFLAETRSSHSETSQLKDFALGAFNVCDIAVTKVCENPRLSASQTSIVYDIRGTVSSVGGTVLNVALSDSPPADGDFAAYNCDTQASLGNFPLASLNGTVCWSNTITVPLEENGTDDTVTATAEAFGVNLSDSATATCPSLDVSPAIRVSKDCAASVEVVGGKVVAKVTVSGSVCNVGDSNLSNVVVDDLNITTSPDPLISGASLVAPADPANPEATTGACLDYSGTYYPSAAQTGTGENTTNPGEVVFKDTVKATARNIFGQDIEPHTDMASCPLCPPCPNCN